MFVLLVNPYKMYVVRGGDTLGNPIHSVSVEAQRWQATRAGLQVEVRALDLDIHRRIKVDTFGVTPLGALQSINGRAPGFSERIDFLLRLPPRALAPDLTWSDTLRSPLGGPSGIDRYNVTRNHRVTRIFDSSGTRLADVRSTAAIEYRQSWWRDSVAGKFVVFDVAGPDTERFLFAVKTGQLWHRSWSMHLVGTATIPGDVAGVDTVPAGLRSEETQDIIPQSRARLLLRPLPGVDTAVTVQKDGGTALLHTVQRGGDTITASMVRNDGVVGTAQARFRRGIVQSYTALWTDTTVTPRQTSIAFDGDSLLKVRDENRDTTLAVPTRWWGIADYAMNELLVPAFLAHPADGMTQDFAIYRPFPRHWDVGVASVRSIGDNFIASFRLGTDSATTYLLITRDGDLLFAENSGPTGAQRLPSEGSARRATLEAILKSLQH